MRSGGRNIGISRIEANLDWPQNHGDTETRFSPRLRASVAKDQNRNFSESCMVRIWKAPVARPKFGASIELDTLLMLIRFKRLKARPAPGAALFRPCQQEWESSWTGPHPPGRIPAHGSNRAADFPPARYQEAGTCPR